MLRSLNSGVSGMRAHQTQLDVTGNNLANVSTVGFKSSSAVFQSTFSQLVRNAGAPVGAQGGTNPAQVGLGVSVAGITKNFTQGILQSTGRATDLAISGDGFFVVNQGGQDYYTRAGSFDFDVNGNLVSPGGAFVMGYSAVNGVVQDNGVLGPISIPKGATSPATATTAASFKGNLPSDAEDGKTINLDMKVHDDLGNATIVTVAFTKTAAGWDASVNGAAPTSLTFDGNGVMQGAGTLTYAGANGPIPIDISAISGFANLSTVEVSAVNGSPAGTLNTFQIGPDGTIVGSFTNGQKQDLGRVAVANFLNPGGLEAGDGSLFSATANSGAPQIGAAGTNGRGALQAGALEGSNVDISGEMVNLITSQRGLQASGRVITVSDSVIDELVNLKR